jgi:hypothetical protein
VVVHAGVQGVVLAEQEKRQVLFDVDEAGADTVPTLPTHAEEVGREGVKSLLQAILAAG